MINSVLRLIWILSIFLLEIKSLIPLAIKPLISKLNLRTDVSAGSSGFFGYKEIIFMKSFDAIMPPLDLY